MAGNFLDSGEKVDKEARWNLFKFQDHLLSWISLSAQHFHNKDYPAAFEALTNVYTDTYGFFNDEEKKEVTGLFNVSLKQNNAYISYGTHYANVRKRSKISTYAPPSGIYHSLLKFRIRLLELMTKYGLTIPQVDKSGAGAGSL